MATPAPTKKVIDAVQYQVFVDEAAECSVAMLQKLSEKSMECERVDDGVYMVAGYPDSVEQVLDQYSNCILKAEPVK